VLLLAGLLDQSTTAISLQAGDCILDPAAAQVTDVDRVECASPHDFEVIGTVTLTGSEYPGSTQVVADARAACEPVFVLYVGEPYEDSPWFINVFTPTAETWADGERSATCLVFQFDENLEVRRVTGSVAGDGRSGA
jgi:hypothetical protein